MFPPLPPARGGQQGLGPGDARREDAESRAIPNVTGCPWLLLLFSALKKKVYQVVECCYYQYCKSENTPLSKPFC